MNRIEHYRKQTGLTQLQASKAAGWKHQSRWSSYERSGTPRGRVPDINDANVIVRVLNEHGIECTLNDVFPPSEIAAKPDATEAA